MNINDVASIKIGLASPEAIIGWSHGEVKKPETINYRSQKPERDGLFCERIFGPVRDWECSCGKYKKVKYKGVVCDRCGVEITRSDVRRERMGHIQLASPVTHIWYLKGIPSRIALLLGVSPKELENVVYFVKWIVIDPKDTPLSRLQILSIREKMEASARYGDNAFVAQTGAEAIKTLLEQTDIEQLYNSVHKELLDAQANSKGGRDKDLSDKCKKLVQRLETIKAFKDSGQKPEWMVLTVLPVIPPDLRPMLELDGGRFATNDLNDLYRRIITRNNRLNKLLELGTPELIVRNEKRMLQEAVDALIDNGRRNKPVLGTGNRPLKSLSSSLKGKQGRFRQNLLGKRVDYSGRSVIAVGPDLKMYQCGIPREMALQLFKPFIINECVHEGIVSNHKTAEKLIEKVDPRVWPIVEKVVSDHPVLLNRAPTLHRLGIQAFMPKLVEGRAIRLHPLVCTAFNADFDGDQMAVHVPLSEEACAEAKVLMLGSNNILSPKDGQPIVTPSQDMVLGNYYLTLEETKYEFLKEAQTIRERYHDEKQAELWEGFAASEGRVYKDMDEVMMAYDQKQTHLHTRIAIKASSLNKSFFTEEQNSKYLITTVGKLIFNSIFPSDFPYINEVKGDWDRELPNKYFVDKGTDIKAYISSMPIHDAVTKKALGKIIKKVYDKYANHDDNKAGDIEGEVYHGEDQTFVYFDRIKDNGFKFATVAGMTVSLDDIKIAPGKENIVAEGNNNSKKIKDRYKLGQYTTEDWEEMLMEEWSSKKDAAVNRLMDNLPRKNPINMMALSGARGNKEQFGQLGGIRGLMSKPTQDKSAKGYTSKVVEIPITSCFREGQTVFDFFIASHGIRKGLTDTALKTAKSGYLTRRLVDVAQAVLVVEDDCGTTDGYKVSAIGENVPLVIDLQGGDYLGKRLGQDVWADAETMIAAKGTILDEDVARSIRMAGISRVVIIDDELTSVRSIEPVGECLVENVIDINGNILATRGTILDEETSRKIIKDGVEIINLNSFKGKNLAEISGQASRKLHDRQLVADVINPVTGEILATKDTAIHDNLVGEMVRSGVSTVVVKAKIYVINELETVVSLVGKTLVADVRDNSAEEAIIARKGDVITEQIANAIIAAGVDTVTVRDEVDVAKNPKIVNKVLVEDVVKGRKVIAAKDTIITNEIAKTIIDSGIRNITVVKKLETSKEIEISRNYPGEAERIDRYIDKTAAKLVGNYLLSDVYDPKTGELIVTRNTDDDNALNIETAYKIISAGVESVMIREDLSLTYNKELVGRTLSEDVVQDGVTLARYNEVLDKKTLRAIYDAGINTVKVQKEPSIIESLEERITGRYAGQEDIINPKTGELIVAQNELITEEKAKEIVGAGITEVYIRNVFICQSRRGVCRKCYGLNMATGKEVENGEAVGIMAAQSIGEPGTQLTMRNFHSGGTAGDDITQGLPRVEALFEARSPKQPAIIAKVDGVITRINERISDRDSSERSVVIQAVGTGEEVVHPIGSQKLEKGVVVGGRVFAGEQLTEGQIAPKELIRCNTSTQTPIEAVQNYILKEVMKVYKSQDIGISDKHLEIMISQMLRNVVVQDPGDSSLTVGSKISKERLLDINSQLLIGEDGMPNFDAKGVKFTQVLSGISKASVETDSWLSAASFQETTKALTDAAVNGKIDVLNGIKENIIIGKKIPAGTGSTAERESTREIKERAERMRAKKLARLEKEKANELTRMQESLDLANFLDEE